MAPPANLRWIYTFFNRRQFYDKIINDLVSLPLFRFGFGVTTSLIDKGMIEVLVPVGLTNSPCRDALVLLPMFVSVDTAFTGSYMRGLEVG